MKHLLSTLFVLLALSSVGQTFKKDLKSFTELKIARGIQATLIKSDSKELEFEVYGVSKSDIIIEQDHDRLYIKVKSKALWEAMVENRWWVKVKIPYQSIKSVDVTTGARLESDGSLESDKLLLTNKMGGEVKLGLKVINLLSVDASMGSMTDLEGMAKNVNIDASMGAVVNAFELKSKVNTVESGMGSEVYVFCDYEFDGSASMGGGIEVKGSPEKVFRSESMGGWIKILMN